MNIEKKDNRISLAYKNATIKLLEFDKNLYRIKITDFDKLENQDEKIFKESFVDFSKKNKIQILTSENYIENDLLLDFGFKIYRSKNLYQKELVKKEKFEKSLVYKTIQEVTESVFLKTFMESVRDYEEKEDYSEKDFFYYLKKIAGEKFNANSWKLVFFNNEPIGVILPQIFPDSHQEGTIYFIGIVEKYRNKGYGKEMQLEAINCLFDCGATTYIGSTLSSNKAMEKVFIKNGCELEAIQNFFKI